MIAFGWKMFGRNGYYHRQPDGVIRSLTSRMSDEHSPRIRAINNVKCVFDPTRITSMHVHKPFVDGCRFFWNDSGDRHRFRARVAPRCLTTKHLQLNHYYTRFGADVEDKIGRGGNYTNRTPHDANLIWRRIDEIERHTVPDHSIIEYLERLKRESSSLLHAES